MSQTTTNEVMDPQPTNRLEATDVTANNEHRELAVDPPQPPWHLTLEPPVEYDNQQWTELTFDFDSLNGKDFQRAERTFHKLFKADRDEFVLPESKHLFHAILAAQVADVPVGLILKLPRRYYVAVRQKAVKACGSSLADDA